MGSMIGVLVSLSHGYEPNIGFKNDMAALSKAVIMLELQYISLFSSFVAV